MSWCPWYILDTDFSNPQQSALDKLNKYIFQNKQYSQHIHAYTDFLEFTADEVDEYITEYS